MRSLCSGNNVAITYVNLVCVGLYVVMSTGCTRVDSGRVIVSGNITYDGQPIGIGQIRFIPQKGTIGPVTISIIEQGHYSSDKTGGVPVGEHRVEILAYDPEEYKNAPIGPGVPPPKQLLPPKYNAKSELSASVQGGQRSATMDFELKH